MIVKLHLYDNVHKVNHSTEFFHDLYRSDKKKVENLLWINFNFNKITLICFIFVRNLFLVNAKIASYCFLGSLYSSRNLRLYDLLISDVMTYFNTSVYQTFHWYNSLMLNESLFCLLFLKWTLRETFYFFYYTFATMSKIEYFRDCKPCRFGLGYIKEKEVYHLYSFTSVMSLIFVVSKYQYTS